MPYQSFTFDEAKRILQLSELALVSGDSDSEGHAGRKHVSITNAGLEGRLIGEKRLLAAYTAFLSFDDQIRALVEVLNSVDAAPKLEQFREQTKPGKWFKDIKDCQVASKTRLRYAAPGGARTFPCNSYTLWLIKDLSRPSGMHVASFFGTMGELV